MKTATEIAKEILYLPVTNNQSDVSIEYGAKLIEAYADQYRDWISVKDLLPESNARILAFVTEDEELFSIIDATYKGMNIFMSDGEYLSFVTHWQYISLPFQFKPHPLTSR